MRIALAQINPTIGDLAGNLLFYGRIADNSSTPFAGVSVDGGGDQNNPFDAKSFTDTLTTWAGNASILPPECRQALPSWKGKP